MSATWGRAGAVAVLMVTLSGGAMAAVKSLAYFGPEDGSSNAYLIDWLPKSRANVVFAQGTGSGAVVNDGVQRTVTFDTPVSTLVPVYDSCSEPIQRRVDTRQVIVRDLAGGISEVVELGDMTNVGGCEDGLVTPFGSPSDTGLTLRRIALAARPAVDDLVAGTEIAGFSEDVRGGDADTIAEDVVTLQSGSMLFRSTGNSVPAAFNADRWLVLSLPGFQRGYTRVALDAKTGGETWLVADWVGGRPVNVRDLMMVKPMAGAGFGAVYEAARMWESGLFMKTRQPFYFYLYRNSTGERVAKDLDLGTEQRAPIAWWGLDEEGNLQQTRNFGGGSRNRTWGPLRNEGAKVHWVLESETMTDAWGNGSVLIKPRVNYYLDTGKAVPPAAASRAKGMVYLNAAPALRR